MFSIVVAVGVKEDAESSEVVLATKHGANLALLLGVPEGKPIAEQVLPLTVHLKLDHNLPVVHTDWLQVHKGEEKGRNLIQHKSNRVLNSSRTANTG